MVKISLSMSNNDFGFRGWNPNPAPIHAGGPFNPYIILPGRCVGEPDIIIPRPVPLSPAMPVILSPAGIATAPVFGSPIPPNPCGQRPPPSQMGGCGGNPFVGGPR